MKMPQMIVNFIFHLFALVRSKYDNVEEIQLQHLFSDHFLLILFYVTHLTVVNYVEVMHCINNNRKVPTKSTVPCDAIAFIINTNFELINNKKEAK